MNMCYTLGIFWITIFGIMADEQNFVSKVGHVDKTMETTSKIPKNSNSSFRVWLNNTLKDYDSRLRPYFGGKAMKIKLQFWLIGISNISEKDMSFTVEMFFHETWKDPRLKFNATQLGVHNPLTLPYNAPKLVWLPDTTFLNALSSITPQRGSVSHLYYIKLYSDGTITQSRRISVTADCRMDLTMYPFDRQACWLELSSYGWTVDDIVYEWSLTKDAINLDDLSLQDYRVTRYMTNLTSRKFTAGLFSVPQMCIELHRRTGFYYLQLIIPATAVVGSSWIALWLESETKFGDLVAVILAVIFLSNSYNTMMPKVNYVKAMDIYLAACFFVAFISLAKLAIVKRMRQNVAKHKEKLKREKAAKAEQVIELVENPTEMLNMEKDGQEGSEWKNIKGDITREKMGGKSGNGLVNRKRLQSRSSTRMSLFIRNNTRMDTEAHHDIYWRLMKAFHISSQLALPLLFIAFGLFYFFIYPYMGTASVCR